MSDSLDYIIINGEEVTRPPAFAPKIEDIYKGDYATCTGKIIADRVGWKFGDLDMEWDGLPQSMVDVLIGMDGASTMTFDAMDGTVYEEQVVRVSAVSMRYRYTVGGEAYWKDVKVSIRFIGSHT